MKSIQPKSRFVRAAMATAILAALPVEYASAQLEEIVVVARKLAETLQEVPVSVSTVSGDSFEQFGGVNVRDLAEMTPNLQIGQGSVSQNVSIRGLGTFISNGGFASSVGLGIDGLFFSQLPWLEVGMFDLQQAEVLRGPQGTYFGKNTTAGLINLVSRAPTEEMEGHITLGYESELEAYRIEGAISGPLSDTVRARLAAQHIEDDGWMENVATGEAVEATDRDIIKLGIDWDASESVQVVSRTSYSNTEVDGNANQVGNCGEGGPLSLLPSLPNMAEDCVVDDKKTGGAQRGPFDQQVQAFVDGGGIALDSLGLPYAPRAGLLTNDNDFRDIETFSQALGVNWELNETSRLVSVTGYATLELEYAVDADFFDASIVATDMPPTQQIFFGPLLGFQNLEEYEQFTQEFRFESSLGDTADYVLGIYYEDSTNELRDLTDFSIDQFFFYASRDKGTDLDFESWALFGEVNWDITEALTVILGARYTDESIDAETYAEVGSLGDAFDDDIGAQTLLGTVGISELDLADDRSTTELSPSVVVQWKASDEGVFYASYKEGFKSGGFDGSVSGPPSIPFYEFDDEGAEAFELGAKWETNSWRANLAVFYTEYTDLQVQVFDGVAATVTRNAASATTQGFELDAMWAPTEALTVMFGLGYTDAEYDDFAEASCYSQQTEAEGCINAVQDLSGEPLQLAPEWTANLGVNWSKQIADGLELELGAALNYRDEVWLSTTLDPASLEDDLTLLNLSAALSGADGRWTVAFIGRNLTDEEYRTGFGDIPFHDAHQERLALPATYELQFTYRFF